MRKRRKRRFRTTEERRLSRELRKELYREYLKSLEWLKVRDIVLQRDGHLCKVPGCGRTATQVHHERYPQNIGEENLDWLHSVCARHHQAIHLLMESGLKLRDATRYYLLPASSEERPKPEFIRLPDDYQLSKRATRKRSLESGRRPSHWAKKAEKARQKKTSV